MPDDLFETPQLKKQRLTGKQQDPNRLTTKGPETIPIGSTSGDESDSYMSKSEIKAKKKRDRLAKKNDKVAIKDPASPAKSVRKEVRLEKLC